MEFNCILEGFPQKARVQLVSKYFMDLGQSSNWSSKRDFRVKVVLHFRHAQCQQKSLGRLLLLWLYQPYLWLPQLLPHGSGA
jgi:hypothetical protein